MNRFLAFVATFFIILPLGIYIGASLLPQGTAGVTTPATSQSNPPVSGPADGQVAQTDNPVSAQEAEILKK